MMAITTSNSTSVKPARLREEENIRNPLSGTSNNRIRMKRIKIQEQPLTQHRSTGGRANSPFAQRNTIG